MVIVAKTKSEYEIKRQKMIDNLKLKAKNRKNYLKAKQILKDTGASMYEPSDNRTTLERLQDLQLLDENLEKLLLKDIGANSGNSKSFLAKLDENLKQFLLERFPEFVKIFNKNFLIPNSLNLRSAFDLFNKAQIEKSKTVEVPSQRVVEDYIRGLNDNAKLLMSNLIIDQLIKRGEFTNFDRRNLMPDDVFRVAIDFLRFFENEIDAYTSLYATLRGNFPDFPKLTIAQEREGIPSNTWNVRPSEVQQIYDEKGDDDEGDDEGDDDEGPSGSTPQTAIPISTGDLLSASIPEGDLVDEPDLIKGAQRYKALQKIGVVELDKKIKEYNRNNPSTKIALKNALKKDKIISLLNRGSNEDATQFDSFNKVSSSELNKLEEYLDKNYTAWTGQQGQQTEYMFQPKSLTLEELEKMEGYGMHDYMKEIIFLR